MAINKPGHGASGWDTTLNQVIDSVNAQDAYRASRGLGSITPQMYGAVGDGTTDDAAAFQAALTAASTSGVDVIVPAGLYKLNSGITYDAEAGSFLGQGYCYLNFTGMASGYAVTVEGVNGRSSSLNNRSSTHMIAGFHVAGPDLDATTVDGFLVQDVPSGSGNLSQVNVNDLYVYGFRDQWYFGDNTWCWRFTNCAMSHAHRRILSMMSGLNAGENYSFYGCTFFSSSNAAHTATAVYEDPTSNVDAYFFGCSFDYNDVEIEWGSGIINLLGCHLENRGANNGNPMVKLSYTGGQAHTTFSMQGGSVSPTETTPGRASLIETSGGNVAVSFSGTKVNTFGYATELVKPISATPSYSWQGGEFDTNSGAVISTPGVPANNLFNGDFEQANTTGWSNGGTVTYTAQTSTVSSGTYALKIAGTGVAGTSSMKQTLVCPPNVDIIAYADMAADTMTGGSVLYQVQFKASDLTTISTSTVTTVSANQAFARNGSKIRSPKGTAFALIQFIPTNLNGNVYADNVYCAIMAPSVGGSLITFGTSANTIAQGNDSRIANALSTTVYPTFKSGGYFVVGGEAGPSTSNTLGLNTFRAVPVRIYSTTTLTKLACDITAAGDTGGHFRMGIYSDDGTGFPGNLLVDGGQVAADAIASPEVTISTTLAPGTYWIGGAIQDVTTTQPTFRTISSGWQPPVPLRVGTSTPPSSTSALCYSMTSVTGSLPSTFTVASATSPMARIAFKVA